MSASLAAQIDANDPTGLYMPVSGGTFTGNVIFNKQITSPAGGSGNEAFGEYALGNMKGSGSGTLNTALGYASMLSNQNSNANTALGYGVMSNHDTGNNNTAVGTSAMAAGLSKSGCVAIGCQAGYWETRDNKLWIANLPGGSLAAASGEALLHGDFVTGELWKKGQLIATVNDISGFIGRTEVASISSDLYAIDVATSGNLVSLIASTSATLASSDWQTVSGTAAADITIFNVEPTVIGDPYGYKAEVVITNGTVYKKCTIDAIYDWATFTAYTEHSIVELGGIYSGATLFADGIAGVMSLKLAVTSGTHKYKVKYLFI